MEKITKTIFETPLTIAKLVEEIILYSVIDESKTIYVKQNPIGQ
jgi:hypothetical protein